MYDSWFMDNDEGDDSSITISYRVAKGIADQMDDYVKKKKLFRNRSEFSSMAVRYFLEHLHETDEKRIYTQRMDVQHILEQGKKG
jgi:Arc/MetJ-type ribon-helix-helix transcriptional regulator